MRSSLRSLGRRLLVGCSRGYWIDATDSLARSISAIEDNCKLPSHGIIFKSARCPTYSGYYCSTVCSLVQRRSLPEVGKVWLECDVGLSWRKLSLYDKRCCVNMGFWEAVCTFGAVWNDLRNWVGNVMLVKLSSSALRADRCTWQIIWIAARLWSPTLV